VRSSADRGTRRAAVYGIAFAQRPEIDHGVVGWRQYNDSQDSPSKLLGNGTARRQALAASQQSRRALPQRWLGSPARVDNCTRTKALATQRFARSKRQNSDVSVISESPVKAKLSSDRLAAFS
jgi:hypothetical protein